MKKITIGIFTFSLLFLFGCGTKTAEEEPKATEVTDSPGLDTEGKTEDEIAQAEFEKLIAAPETPQKRSKEAPVVIIDDVGLDDVEIFEVTPEDLKLVD